jgi:hypothetical protein
LVDNDKNKIPSKTFNVDRRCQTSSKIRNWYGAQNIQADKNGMHLRRHRLNTELYQLPSLFITEQDGMKIMPGNLGKEEVKGLWPI